MAEQFDYDVFLSYSSNDRPVVRELAQRLKADGLRVWFDEWEIKPGDMIGKRIEEGLAASRVLVLAMSANAFGSEWAAMESGTFRFRDSANRRRRFVPVRLDNAAIPAALKQFAYVDWQGRIQAEYERLVVACRPDAAQAVSEATPAALRSVAELSLGHTSTISCIAWSPDGYRAVSASHDNTLRVWDVAARHCIRVLEGHTSWVRSVAWSPDGRKVLSGSDDKTVRLWDVATGRPLAILHGHAGFVLSVALSPDGRQALSGSDDSTLRQWDLAEGLCIATCTGHTNSVFSVAFSPDGRHALSGSSDNTLRLWDLISKRPPAILHGHTNSVFSVAFSPDGQRALSGSHDKTLRLWDLPAGLVRATLTGHTNSVFSVAFSRDGRQGLSGSSDNTLRFWDFESHSCLAVLHGHTNSVLSVTFSPDGRQALSGSEDRTLRVWAPAAGEARDTLQGHTNSVLSVAFSPDRSQALSGSSDNTLRLWQVSAKCPLTTLPGHTNSVFSVAFSPDGRQALSGSLDSTLRLWDLGTSSLLAILRGHASSVVSVAFGPDGRHALSGSSDGSIRLWDLASRNCRATLTGHKDWVRDVAFSPDGKRALTASHDKTLRLWDLTDCRPIGTLTGHTNSVLSVAFSPDGCRALSGSEDRTLRIWDLHSHRQLAVLQGHTDSVRSVAFSPNGRQALSGSDDKTLHLWDLASGCCLATLQGHASAICSVAFCPDGRRALSAAVNGVAREWVLDGPAAREAAAPAATRYSNAKVLLVGESGVGKTSLAHYLTEGHFRQSASTDTAWATQLALPAGPPDGPYEVQREVWLWDFAGQADYRLIQHLNTIDATVAVLVFNPQNENPFDGLGQWDHELGKAAGRPLRKLLVGGRVDRGGLMVARADLERFAKERGFRDYLETSALTGAGCDGLRAAIARHIPWDELPYTSSPRIYRLIRDEIIKLRNEGKALLRMAELRQQLELRLRGEVFTVEQLRTVVRLLAGTGVVRELEFGDFVLLQPERMNAYAAAVVRAVRKHPGEIGAIAEEDLLAGNLDYQDMQRLPSDEEPTVLRALHQTLVDRGLCLRERADRATLLVFPSLFTRERLEALDVGVPVVTYHFSGALNEIYATLVVRLHYTVAFDKDKLWRFAAGFKTQAGQRVGLKMTKKAEGAAELVVYADPKVPAETQVTFIRYVHEHLTAKAVGEVKRERHYVCGNCGAAIENRRAVTDRLGRGLKDILCVSCEERVVLWDLIEEKFASEEFKQRVRELEEQAKARIDNESRELILVGQAYAVSGEAGMIYRQYTNSDHGIDGEIEFKDYQGRASGKRLYLQLKSGDSYLYKRERDGAEVFTIRNPRHAEYWQQQAYPVMLVIRTSDGVTRWMDVSEYLRRESDGGKKVVKQVVFEGEAFTAMSLLEWRRRVLGAPA